MFFFSCSDLFLYNTVITSVAEEGAGHFAGCLLSVCSRFLVSCSGLFFLLQLVPEKECHL